MDGSQTTHQTGIKDLMMPDTKTKQKSYNQIASVIVPQWLLVILVD